MKNAASFLLLMLLFGGGAFAIAATPGPKPNEEGLSKCLRFHPSRYCRIVNGFPITRP